MSNEQPVDSNGSGVQTQAEGNPQESQDQFVKRQAYEEVSKDMHKFKSKLKETQAMANEYEAKLKAIEEQKLKDQEEWQKLYENERKQREEVEQRVTQEKNNYLKAVKLAALKSELGGNVKDTYLIHADLNGIEFNDDGTLSPESVKAVANKFREEHSLLIPTSTNNNITNQAPASGQSIKSKDKTLNDLSFKERADMLKNLKK